MFSKKIILPIVLLGLGLLWFLNSSNASSIQGNFTSHECPIILPPWTKRYQPPNTNVLISTAEKSLDGMHLLVQNEKGEQVNKVSEPSWKIGGTLGNFTFDKQQNIYLVPTPIITQLNNPREERQSIFRVDSTTGIMEKWLDLPIPDDIKAIDDTSYLSNVYGNIAITSDCKNGKLYVSTVTGSDRQTSRGQINEVDIATKSVKNIAKNLDAYGLLRIEDSNKNQFLLFGNTRTTTMGFVDLNSGYIKKDELAYDNPTAIRWDSKIKKMRLKTDVLEMTMYPFDYTLATSSDNLNTKVNYKYQNNSWVLQK